MKLTNAKQGLLFRLLGGLTQFLDRQRFALARPDAVMPMSALGLVVGLLSGLVIVLFRYLIETLQTALLPSGLAENYEQLPWMARGLFLAFGALIIWLLFKLLKTDSRQVGVAHVIEVLSQHRGRLPPANWLGQFLGAGAAIVGGFSVGREGPGIHLGAAGGSLLGVYLRLPNNSMRTLIACGAAASIAASFNTPLAGVIFTMEVIMMDYSIIGFAPIILAAVSATVVGRAFYGNSPAFLVPPTDLASLPDLVSLALLGLLAGFLSAFFIHALEFFAAFRKASPPFQRLLLAMFITLPCAWLAPEIMGIGYDTVQRVLEGSLALHLLLLILGLKLLATSAAIGLGIPGGLIGPTLILGATSGGLLAGVAYTLFPGAIDSSPALYVMIGMIAFMGATLHAPLAALVTLLEMTYNPNIILPGMLAVIIASSISREVFKKEPVFLRLLKVRGLNINHTPASQWLQRVGVESAMDPSILAVEEQATDEIVEKILKDQPRWILLYKDQLPHGMLHGDALRKLLTPAEEQAAPEKTPARPRCHDLASLGLDKTTLARCSTQDTLWEARDIMDRTGTDALYVQSPYDPGINGLRGIITRKIIDSHY